MAAEARYFSLTCTTDGPSRVGGGLPAVLLSEPALGRGRRFFLTLSHVDFPALGERDLSVLFDGDFSPFGESTVYPDIGIRCLLHPPCQMTSGTEGIIPELSRGSLFEQGDVKDSWFIKYGGAPELVQEEDYHQRALLDAGFEFLFQVDEDGYPDGFLSGRYPLCYGALYVFAKFDRTGRVIDVTAGFTQF